MLLSPDWQQEGGEGVHIVIAFFVSLGAGIAANYICKWLGRNRK